MRTPLLLVLSVLPGACAVEVHETSVWNHRSSWGLEDRTGTEVAILNSPADVDSTTVELQLGGHAGTAAIELTDPDGVVRYRETFRGGDRTIELRFDPVPGEWCCRFGFEHFSGSYQVRLGARSEPGLRITGTTTEVEVR